MRDTGPIPFSWLGWRHGRVILFPWEAVPFESDLVAYAESLGQPLLDAVDLATSGRPVPLLLGALQSEFRSLLESFLNRHDRGFDGRPIRSTSGYPRAQVPLETMRALAAALRSADCPGMQTVLDAIADCDAAEADLSLNSVAALLARFYSVLPAAIPKESTSPAAFDPPPALDPEAYLAADPVYRAPVADFTRLVRGRLSWAFRHVLLHGSLATEDYLPGVSDFDLFAIVREDVAASHARLLALREELTAAYPCLYRIDPLQHHGVLLCAAQDTRFYPQAFFPFTLYEHGCTLYSEPGYRLAFAERNDSWDRRHTLYLIRQHYRWYAGEALPPASQFDAKLQIQRLLLLPSFFLQRDGTYTYKRESFPKIHEGLPAGDLHCIDRAEEVRRRNLYGIPLSWDEFDHASTSPAERALAFHRAVREFPVSRELLDFLGSDFWHRASEFTDLLMDGPAQADFLDRAARSIVWNHPPRPAGIEEYASAAAGMRDAVKRINPALEVWQFGSVQHPGISDIDFIIECPADTSLAELDRFAAAEPDYVVHDRPSMIVRPHELRTLATYYPIFDVIRCGSSDAMQFSGEAYARQWLCALAELACCYFFRQTLAALLRREVDVRQCLLTCAGYKHSARVLLANGVDTAAIDAFGGRIDRLRGEWFQMDQDGQRRELLRALLDTVQIEFAVLDGIRQAMPAILDCRPALEDLPDGAVVAVLFDEVLFVNGWSADSALASMLRIFRMTGGVKLIYPAEIGVFLARSASGPGPFPEWLRSRFVCRLKHVESLEFAPDAAGRVNLINDHYAFLGRAGLHWGGVPHWALDPAAAAAVDEPWTVDARKTLSGPSPVTVAEYIASVARVTDLIRATRGRLDAGDFGEARRLAAEALRLSPENAEALYLAGYSLLPDAASAGEAASLLTRALDAGFDPFWVSLARSQAYIAAGDPTAAVADLNAAAARNPGHPSVSSLRRLIADRFANRAGAEVNDGRYSDAAESARAALALAPTHATASYLLAYALQSLAAAPEEALENYERALAGGFDPFWVHYNRAQLHLTSGNLEFAAADIETAAALQPDHAGVATIREALHHRQSGGAP